MSTINSVRSITESKPKTDDWQTGFTDAAGEPTEEVREIMRRNSEALEEMITSKKVRVSR